MFGQLHAFRCAKSQPTFATRYRALRAVCDFGIIQALYWAL